MKVCTKCRQPKPLEAFGRAKDASDGKRSHCLACVKAWRDAYRIAHPDRVNGSHKKYRRAEHGHATVVGIFRNACRLGKVTPQPCIVCGAKAEGHHHDYSRPLEVTWLCQEHHKQVHVEARIYLAQSAA